MEDMFQVFDDDVTFSFQGSEQSIQVVNNYQLAPYDQYASCNNNQQYHNLDAAVPFGVDTFDQRPVLFLDQSNNNSFAENSRQVWQRMRWTDEMVRVLITAASYASPPADPRCETSHQLLAPVKGKWRSISSTMVERGYMVSPQQCEDKFNDLNKKYKRLNDILGTDLSPDVVENPMLMESMNISEQAKEEVRKILTCKQLFYKEMCSYHNKNRKFLPHDAPLEQSVRSALKISKARYGFQNVNSGMPAKRPRKHKKNDTGVSKELPDLPEGQHGLTVSYSLELAEKKLWIQNQMLKLEKNKFEWLRSCEEEDMELRKMKLENEFLKLENERLALQLKCREMCDADAEADAV